MKTNKEIAQYEQFKIQDGRFVIFVQKQRIQKGPTNETFVQKHKHNKRVNVFITSRLFKPCKWAVFLAHEIHLIFLFLFNLINQPVMESERKERFTLGKEEMRNHFSSKRLELHNRNVFKLMCQQHRRIHNVTFRQMV